MSTALPHLANISYRLGRTIVFDGPSMELGAVSLSNRKNEKFISPSGGADSAADKMLTRNYRRPYAVPDRV